MTKKETFKKYLKIIKDFMSKKYVVWPCIVSLFLMFFLLNLYLMKSNSYSVEQINYTFNHLLKEPHSITTSLVSIGDFKIIKEHIWALLATITGGAGLAIAGLITQALTRNPLADASTLGMTQSGIFGIILALFAGFTVYETKFAFALIFGIVSVLILLLIISFSRGNKSTASSKIILTGLAIGIIFKTLSFLLRKGDKFLESVSYNYVLGGAESVNKVIGNNQFTILFISMSLIFAAGIMLAYISKGLTLLELGDERAKNLGVKVKLVKVISLIALALAIPASIMIVGNVAFIGLFSVHLSRYLFKTRSYRTLLVPTLFLSVIITSFGLLLTQYIPSINSGLWMTFIGAPYLMYAGIRGLR